MIAVSEKQRSKEYISEHYSIYILVDTLTFKNYQTDWMENKKTIPLVKS